MAGKADDGFQKHMGVDNQKDTILQIALSAALGVGAFVAFCVSPQWYAKRTFEPQLILSDLASSLDWPLCCSQEAERCSNGAS